MMSKVAIAGAMVVLGLLGCAGSGASPPAQAPGSSAQQPAGPNDADPSAAEPTNDAPGEERVRAADLPGEPDGAMGFVFGERPNEAEDACTSAGHAWRTLDATTYHCDALPEADDVQGTVFLRTCDGEVCLIRAALTPADTSAEGWLALYERALALLEDRHGEPRRKQHQLPSRCRGEELEGCLEEGKAALDATWRWPGGQKVELRLVPPTKARSIAVRLTYSTTP